MSGNAQVQGDGFDRQRAAIENYAGANDLKIVRYFQEEGVSGTTEWDNRPAWMEMISQVNPQLKTIVVERLDRLARDLGLQEFVIRQLAARKITLLSTAEPDLGSTDPTRVLFRQVVGAVAAFEKSMIVCKLRAARDRMKKRTGRCEGRKPYGYDENYPREPEVLQMMKRWKQEKYSFHEMALKLNAMQVSTRDSGKWHGCTVSRILHREEKLEAGK